MALTIVLPRMGWTMEEGTFGEWLKHDGAVVNVGDRLFTVESDKALEEVEALDAGILRIPPDAPPSGTRLAVGTVLAYLVKPGEPAPFELATPPTPAPSIVPAPGVVAATVATPSPPVAQAGGRRAGTTISPRARRIAQELGVAWTTLQGSGRTGRIIERDVRAALVVAPLPAPDVRISPLARRMAEANGVDIALLTPTQPGKRIGRAEVEAALPPPSTSSSVVGEGQPLSSMRRLIGTRMSESRQVTAPVTLTTEADATELVKLRTQLKTELNGTGIVPTYTDFLAKLVAVALAEHPQLNASLDGDTLVQHPAVHIGVAVDTERGLLVPVIRDVQAKSVGQIAQAAAHLTEQARTGRIATDALRGGTFTLTNLGMYDIDAFTPIINLPECAILGVGRIVARPVVVDDATETIAVRRMLALSLTFDHRLVDGAPAARFLQRVKRLIERPLAALLA